MKLLADSKGRLACKALFPPRTPFSAQRQADGSIRVVELVEKEVPVVRPVRTREGFLMLPRKLDRKTITAAIRADRDAR
jgi:hypothetical protein